MRGCLAKKKKIPLQIYKKPSLSLSAVNGRLRAIKRLCFPAVFPHLSFRC